MVRGLPIHLYTLTNTRRMVAALTDYGGILVSLKVPDRFGDIADVVLGYTELSGYLANNSPYMGAIVGRCCNRIGGARFRLKGEEHFLTANDGSHSLHGGREGFDKKIWQSQPVERKDAVGVELRYRSPNGEEGYPGNLEVLVVYWLTDDGRLQIDYQATTDRTTVVNLTHHSYFNLAGEGCGEILEHVLMLVADRFVPIDDMAIPIGGLVPVEGTPMDFREPAAIGSRIDANFEQLRNGKGYDHCWVLNQAVGSPDGGTPAAEGNERIVEGASPCEQRLAATLFEPESGRFMEVHTSEPAIQFYTGNYLDGSIVGKSGRPYGFRHGLCLETQHCPDSPNRPEFPSVVLEPGEVLRSRTSYRFSTR